MNFSFYIAFLFVFFTKLLFGAGVPSGNQSMEISGAGPIPVPSAGIVDGPVLPQHIPTKRMIPYEYVREADMMWSKRTWEYIDLREKINLLLYYPLDEIKGDYWIRNNSRWSLWTIIRSHVMNGDLTVFSPYHPMDLNRSWNQDGDQLKYPIAPASGKTYFTDVSYQENLNGYYIGVRNNLTPPVKVYDAAGNPIMVPIYDANGQKIPDGFGGWLEQDSVLTYTTTPIISKDIVQYRLKQDWFFDKERSVLDVRIIAIAPVAYDIENGQIKGLRELFWLYFPHCRFVFNNYFVYNDRNDSQWMSFDDLFWKRRFNGVIYKASNTYDRDVESFRFGIDALYESERLKDEIRLIEHDVWSF